MSWSRVCSTVGNKHRFPQLSGFNFLTGVRLCHVLGLVCANCHCCCCLTGVRLCPVLGLVCANCRCCCLTGVRLCPVLGLFVCKLLFLYWASMPLWILNELSPFRCKHIYIYIYIYRCVCVVIAACGSQLRYWRWRLVFAG